MKYSAVFESGCPFAAYAYLTTSSSFVRVVNSVECAAQRYTFTEFLFGHEMNFRYIHCYDEPINGNKVAHMVFTDENDNTYNVIIREE